MKLRRQSKILELIGKYEIETQEELMRLLKQAGFKVTQATISRDARELNLIKVSFKNTDNEAKLRYVSMASDTKNINEKFSRVFKEALVSIDYAQNIIVLKALEGMGMAIASCVDGMSLPEVVGCIAGDNTVFCVCKSEHEAVHIVSRLREYTK